MYQAQNWVMFWSRWVSVEKNVGKFLFFFFFFCGGCGEVSMESGAKKTLRRNSLHASVTLPDVLFCCKRVYLEQVYKLIWSSMVTHTVQNIAWQPQKKTLLGELLLTLSQHWRTRTSEVWRSQAFCPICGTETTDCFHALCRCPLAIQLWECMFELWRLPKLKDVTKQELSGYLRYYTHWEMLSELWLCSPFGVVGITVMS